MIPAYLINCSKTILKSGAKINNLQEKVNIGEKYKLVTNPPIAPEAKELGLIFNNLAIALQILFAGINTVTRVDTTNPKSVVHKIYIS